MTNLRRELASRNRTIEYNHLKKHVTDLIASGFVEYHGIKPRTAKHRLGERRTKSWTMGEIRHRFNAKYITTKRGEEYISQFNKLEEFFYEYWEQCN
jgi:cytochrome c-type biogenesis protein CcmE